MLILIMTMLAKKKIVFKNSKTLAVYTGERKHFIRTSDPNALDKIKETIEHWKSQDRLATKKAVFDYISEDRLFYSLLFGMIFFIVGGIAILFLSDGIQTHRCTEYMLMDNAKLAQATITKIKKNRRGNIVWDLKFNAESGEEITGRRTALLPDSAIYTPGKKEASTSVIYSPDHLSCWDISLQLNEKHLPTAQRRFSTSFTLGFGSFFALMWIIFTFILWKKVVVKRPFIDELRLIYEKI